MNKKINVELSQEQLNSLIFVLETNIEMCESTNHIHDPLGKGIEDKKELLKYLESKKTIQLTENTRQWLKLINKIYKYIARDSSGELNAFGSMPFKCFKYDDIDVSYKGWDTKDSDYMEISEELFDIDLSFIQWEDEEPYLISDLLGEEQ